MTIRSRSLGTRPRPRERDPRWENHERHWNCLQKGLQPSLQDEEPRFSHVFRTMKKDLEDLVWPRLTPGDFHWSRFIAKINKFSWLMRRVVVHCFCVGDKELSVVLPTCADLDAAVTWRK